MGYARPVRASHRPLQSYSPTDCTRWKAPTTLCLRFVVVGREGGREGRERGREGGREGRGGGLTQVVHVLHKHTRCHIARYTPSIHTHKTHYFSSSTSNAVCVCVCVCACVAGVSALCRKHGCALPLLLCVSGLSPPP